MEGTALDIDRQAGGSSDVATTPGGTDDHPFSSPTTFDGSATKTRTTSGLNLQKNKNQNSVDLM